MNLKLNILKTVLITGANGLIGASLLRNLTEDNNYQVYCLGRNGDSNETVRFIKADLSKDWDEAILPERIDIIIHLAQSDKFREFPSFDLDVFNVNTYTTMKLLSYAQKAGVQKFIYASSGGVYGSSNQNLEESVRLVSNPDLGFYLTTKFCSEMIAENYMSFFDVNILRFFFVYGPEQKKDMLIPRLIRSIKNEMPITLQGESGLSLNPIFVEDAANAVISVMKRAGSGIINIAGDEVVTLKELCECIAKIVGKEPVFNIQSEKSAAHLIADITKIKDLVGSYTVSLSEGLKLTADAV